MESSYILKSLFISFLVSEIIHRCGGTKFYIIRKCQFGNQRILDTFLGT